MGDEEDLRDLGEQLYDLLLAPIVSQEPNCNQLIIIPDDCLHRLPFDVLTVDVEQLDELDIVLHSADELEYESSQQDGFNWSQLLIGLLVALLLGEQLLAYSASYHPRDQKRPGQTKKATQPTRRFARLTSLDR